MIGRRSGHLHLIYVCTCMYCISYHETDTESKIHEQLIRRHVYTCIIYYKG